MATLVLSVVGFVAPSVPVRAATEQLETAYSRPAGGAATVPRRTNPRSEAELRPRAVPASLAAALTLFASLSVIWVSPAAAADASAESQLVAWINSARRDAGLHELVVRGDLRDVARRHSRSMADRETLEHNPNRRSEICCWQELGENVAYGSDLRDIHRRLMGSSGHRTNILSPHFTEVGVGVERRGGVYWVTQDFRLPRGASAPAPPPPPPEEEPPPPPARQEPAPPPPPQPPPPPPPPPSADDRFAVMMGRVESLESDQPFGEMVSQMDTDDGS